MMLSRTLASSSSRRAAAASIRRMMVNPAATTISSSSTRFFSSTNTTTTTSNKPQQFMTKPLVSSSPSSTTTTSQIWQHKDISLPQKPYLHLQDRPYLLQPIPLSPPTNPSNRILYEVTLEIDEDIVEPYMAWIRQGHIQEVMALPGFLSWNISMSEGDEAKTKGKDGQTRVVFVEKYEVTSREALEVYFNEYAQGIRDDHTRMWDGKFAASRRILSVFGKQTEAEAQLWKNREARNVFRLQNLKEQREKMPLFTTEGLKVQQLPGELWEKLRTFYVMNKARAVEDCLDPNEISINTWVVPTWRLDLPPALAEEVVGTMKPLLQEWSGIPELEPTGISGIRTYKSGATIAKHVDMATTNVISALINIDQDVTEPWPFEMCDHTGEMHSLHMRPGEVAMYESAVCAHQRSKPLKGNGYTNLFMRFKPKGWEFKGYEEEGEGKK